MSSIAFLGLGNMGGPMAANLVKAGRRVIGYDPDAAACERARAIGVEIAPSAIAACESAEGIITMLPAGAHVLACWAEILPHARQGSLFIDCSTIEVESARSAHADGAKRGMACLDAPVSGGVGGATGATLTFMVGGDATAFARAMPLLEIMGKRIVHCGGAGAGQAAKICNNMILGVTMIATCEGFLLAEKLGLSAQALFDVASSSSGQSWSLTSYCPVPGPVPASPANHGYKPGFSAALMSKDLRLSQLAAERNGAPTPMGAHAAALYEEMLQKGRAGEDFSAIIEMLRGI